MKQKVQIAINPDRIAVGRYKQNDFDKPESYKHLNGAEWITVDKRRVFDMPEYTFEYDPATSKLTVYKEIEVDV